MKPRRSRKTYKYKAQLIRLVEFMRGKNYGYKIIYVDKKERY